MPDTIVAPTEEPKVGPAPAGTEAPAPEKGTNVPVEQPKSPEGTPPPESAQAEVRPEDVPEDYVWEGDANNLPKPLQNRAKGVLRYLTKQSQALSEEKKLAEEYKQIKSDPLYQQFLNYKNGNSNLNSQSQSTQVEQPIFTQAELEEAQINPTKLGELIQKAADTKIAQAEQVVSQKLSAIENRQMFVDKKQELQDFAELHPDFWDLHEDGLIKPFLREIVDTGQGTIMDAYNKAKSVQEKYRQQAIQQAQARVGQKKAAFSSTPSPSNDPDVIWANDRNDATRIAFENALLGKKVQVKVKK